MWYHLSADLVVFVHVTFVGFVLLGGILILKWRRMVWLHLPAASWGAFVEFSGWICPLTPLENWLREQAGEAGYDDDFMTHYFLPILYPDALTREVQMILGCAVVFLNVAIYWWLWKQHSFAGPPTQRALRREGP